MGTQRSTRRFRAPLALAVLATASVVSLVLPGVASALDTPMITAPEDGQLLGPHTWNRVVSFTADTTGAAGFTLFRTPLVGSCGLTPPIGSNVASEPAPAPPAMAPDFDDSTIADNTWCYWVESSDGIALTADSVPITITYDSTPPTDPSGLRLDSSSTASSDPVIDYTTASADGHGAVTYELFRDGVTTGLTSTSLSMDDTTLAHTAGNSGSHDYTVVATDAAGNPSGSSSPLAVTSDFSPPAGLGSLTLVGSSPRTTAPSFTFAPATDAHGPITYTLLRGTTPAGTLTSAATTGTLAIGDTSSPADGPYSYTLTATDDLVPANTSAPTDAVPVTIDTADPTAPGSFQLADARDPRNTAPVFSFTGSADATTVTYALLRDGSPTGDSTTTPGSITDTQVSLSPATHTYSYTLLATDAAGNHVTSSAASVTLDTDPPGKPTALAVADGLTVRNSYPTITFDAPSSSGESITYELVRDAVDTQLFVTTTAATASIEDTSLFLDGSDDGPLTYTIVPTDAAGNVGTESDALGVTLDTTPPSPPGSFASAVTLTNAVPSFTFAFVANRTYKLYRSDVPGTPVATTSTAGTITDTSMSGVPAEGTFVYTLTGTDSANNESVRTTSRSVTVDTTPPTLPTGLTLSNTPAITNARPSFSFTPSTDVHGPIVYTLFRDGVATGDSSQVGTISDTTLPLTGTAVVHGYTVKATDHANNTTPASSPVSVTTDFVAPTVPTSFTITTTLNNHRPSFDFVAPLPLDTTIARYELFRLDVSTGIRVDTGVSVPSGPSITDDSLHTDGSSDGSFVYSLRAIDSAGNSSGDSATQSFTFDAGPPTQPGAVQVAASPTRTAPAISWIASSGVPVKYRVSRDGIAIDDVFAPTTTFTDSALPLNGAADGAHRYSVVAIDAAGNISAVSPSADDVVDTTRPLSTGSLAITTPTATKPVLVWAAAADLHIAGYNVYRGSTLLSTTLVRDTSFTDSSLAGDGSYSYTVRAVDTAGNESPDSAAAVVVYDTTAPVAPAASAALGTAGDGSTVTWTASADAGSGVASYQVRRSAPNGPAPTSLDEGAPVCGIVDAATLGCADSGLTPGASYRYSVFATDAVGNVSAAGQSTEIAIPVVRDTTAPRAPTAVRRKVVGARVTLTWKNPKDDLAKVVVVWNAKRAPRSAGDGTTIYQGAGSSVSVKLAKLPVGKKVHFAVFALDGAGNTSVAANTVIFVPRAGPLSVAPGGKLSGSPRLSWRTVSRATYYNVQVFEGSGTKKRVAASWPVGTSYVLSSRDLVKGRRYTWYVWPGIGAKAAARHGKLLGKQTFRYTG